ncbi:MAG: sigma-70 family RNA polymerase sigma factor [Ignavibacteriales bacterium]|nr:sigma-70 family RNA polymerase sigma factor [Ignavibacteriales bacterium]
MKNSDQDIIRRVLAGEQKAYAELIDRHKEKAMTFAVRMLKNRFDAEEALQDAFIRAFKALPGFEWKSSFSTWFYRIVFNVCSTALGKKGDTTFISIQDESDDRLSLEIPSTDDEPDVEFDQKEFSAIIRQEIEKMDAGYSAILTMFFLQEMSYEEIMSVTGLPLGTVKNRLFRARTQLRTAVLRHFSDEKMLERI